MGSITARSTARLAIALLVACTLLPGCRPAAEPASSPPPLQAATTGTAQPADFSGTYALVSVNGSTLPYTMTHEGPGLQVTSGAFVIRADGTCTSTIAFVLPNGQTSSREVGATWTRDGTKLSMSWQGAGTNTGTVEGSTFTMDNEGQIFVYRRQP
jgi:hypothetical protein